VGGGARGGEAQKGGNTCNARVLSVAETVSLGEGADRGSREIRDKHMEVSISRIGRSYGRAGPFGKTRDHFRRARRTDGDWEGQTQHLAYRHFLLDLGGEFFGQEHREHQRRKL